MSPARILLAILLAVGTAVSSFGGYVVPCTSNALQSGFSVELVPSSLRNPSGGTVIQVHDTMPFDLRSLDTPVVTRPEPGVIRVTQTGFGGITLPMGACVSVTVPAGDLEPAAYTIEWDYRINDGLVHEFHTTRTGSFSVDATRPDMTIEPRTPTTATPVTITISGRTPNMSNAGAPVAQLSGPHIDVSLDVSEGPLTSFGGYKKSVTLPPLAAGHYDVEVTVRRTTSGVYAAIDRRLVSFDVIETPTSIPRRRSAGH